MIFTYYKYNFKYKLHLILFMYTYIQFLCIIFFNFSFIFQPEYYIDFFLNPCVLIIWLVKFILSH